VLTFRLNVSCVQAVVGLQGWRLQILVLPQTRQCLQGRPGCFNAVTQLPYDMRQGKLGELWCAGAGAAAKGAPSASSAADGVFASLIRDVSLHVAASFVAGSLLCAGAGAAANGAVSASSAADGVFASSTGGSGQDSLLQTGGNNGASSASASEMAANSG
jgi:hypothetical protein